MSTSKSPSVAQKKKRQERLVQLRDAQRRRRERLKKDHQHFVQIILPEKTLRQLGEIIVATGETMQQAIARLVQQALPGAGETFAERLPLAKPIAEAAVQPVVKIEETTTNSFVIPAPMPEVEGVVESVETMEETQPPEIADEEMEPAAHSVESPLEEETVPAKGGQLDLFG